jgi:hypothetical protein
LLTRMGKSYCLVVRVLEMAYCRERRKVEGKVKSPDFRRCISSRKGCKFDRPLSAPSPAAHPPAAAPASLRPPDRGSRSACESSRAPCILDAVYAAADVSGRCRIEEAVLITGVYGSGKSSVAEEMTAVLEEHDAPYALLDLDFLAWFDTGSEGGPTEHLMMLRNLAALVSNYLDVGIRFFVLAKALRDRAELEDLRAGLPMPLKVVRLTVPLEEIEERLSHDPSSSPVSAHSSSPSLAISFIRSTSACP